MSNNELCGEQNKVYLLMLTTLWGQRSEKPDKVDEYETEGPLKVLNWPLCYA
jgi:hypothetical protein